ncbi:MAG: pseudaminic acid synthase [Christensenellaceae bacterium]
MKLYDKITSGKVYTIAEMSANHAGSLDTALRIVRAACSAGADCLKIQTYTADTMTLPCSSDYFKVKGGLWDGYTLYDLYSEAALPLDWQAEIKHETEKLGMDFLSTPFDRTAVDFLSNLGVCMYKIASYELTDIPLLKYTAAQGKPILLSTGMGTLEEIGQAIDAIKSCGNDQIILLKCTSEYPAHFEDMNLAVIPDMINRFGLPVGLSDHSMGTLAGVVAVSLGACIIEKHFCLSREIKNPDSEFSMEPAEFQRLVQDANSAAIIRGKATYELNKRETDGRWCRRSVFVSRDIKRGEIFTEENIRVIRPADGLAPALFEDVLGKRSACDISFGTPLADNHIAK